MSWVTNADIDEDNCDDDVDVDDVDDDDFRGEDDNVELTGAFAV